MRTAPVRVLVCGLLAATVQAHAFSPKCALQLTQCVSVQGKSVPLADAEEMVRECRDFTRRNIGARVLRMSVEEILKAGGGRPMHPLLLAHFAYESLYDSSLEFDRRLPIEQRYGPMKRACAQVFRDMRALPPQDDE